MVVQIDERNGAPNQCVSRLWRLFVVESKKKIALLRMRFFPRSFSLSDDKHSELFGLISKILTTLC